LWERIDRQRRRGRPVLRAADGLPVPLLTYTGTWHIYDRDGPAAAATEHYRRGLRPDVAAHLEANRDGAARVGKSPHARVQLARLTTAAYRDIGGHSRRELAEHSGWDANDPGYQFHLDALRADTRIGRQLWAAIGVWPWWPLAREVGGVDQLRGRLPREWWEMPAVVATFEAWAADSQRPLRDLRLARSA
jgi:hypothetical protein